MRVRFWGVRGSTPTPQADFLGYGGNTSCVEIRTGGNEILIFDAGTGIRMLGKALEEEFESTRVRAHVFFSHFHIDHIQGLPFFAPLYRETNHVTFYFAGRQDSNLVMDALAGIMATPYFPIDMSRLPCIRNFIDLVEGTFRVSDAEVIVRKLNHPQGCVGYRVVQGGKVVAYCTDVEHGVAWSDSNLLALADNADCLIVDAQFTPEEYADHVGWGHSTWKQSVESAVQAGARQVVLFHHDPYHDDDAIQAILGEARKIHPDVIAAREGRSLTF
jgi:phosphoribosyl 1,2-cyclic phosphodiesterase